MPFFKLIFANQERLEMCFKELNADLFVTFVPMRYRPQPQQVCVVSEEAVSVNVAAVLKSGFY